jgi:hypothetical protein
MENGQNDRITYSESRTINVGNYENVSTFLSYGADIKKINFRDSTAKIGHSETEVLNDETGAAFEAAVKKVVNRVKAVLDHRETTIRKASAIYDDTTGDLSFDTLAKMPVKKGL